MTVSPSRQRGADKRTADASRDRCRQAQRNSTPKPRAVNTKLAASTVHVLRWANNREAALYHLPTAPRSRSECVDGPRPCPWARCPWSLMVDVSSTGRIHELHPGDETGDDPHRYSCALDFIDEHPDGASLEEIAMELNITKEAVRLLEERALRKLANGSARRMREDAKEDANRREDGWPW